METRSDEFESDAAGLLRAYVDEQSEAIRAGEEGLRSGTDAVHPTRVATRRLRSLIRVFGNLFDAEPARTMDDDLAWYAGLLGAVRERQVLRARFAEAAEAVPADHALREALAIVDERLQTQEEQRSDELMAALSAARYRSLLDALSAWRIAPPLRSGAEAADPEVLLAFVRAAGRNADKRLAASTSRRHGPDDLHRARKAAKRARYAAEVARSVLGEKIAKATIVRYKAVQESLGEHQDSADAVALLTTLRSASRDTQPRLVPAYDELLRREREAAGRALHQATTLATAAARPA
ncbi:MAG: CHAD domain-containing protein [Nocardioidaceae bacterium]